ncbi:MAG: DnaJ domain-containing protein [Oscillospiraceae bacterium]
MNDPYKTLGVSPAASDAEIKQAYRDLAKKYHPDNYAGSPLADLAGEKMSEINAAYDVIQQQRKNGGAGAEYGNPYGNPYARQQSGPQAAGQFADIRRMIQMGRVFDAEELLGGVPQSRRDAEWNFLKGHVLYSRGFLDDALQYFQTAVGLDPQNAEYQQALDAVLRQRQYNYNGGQVSYNSCSPCNLCSAMLCANCTCNTFRCCCGGY